MSDSPEDESGGAPKPCRVCGKSVGCKCAPPENTVALDVE